MAAPSKLTPDLIAEIARCVRAGNFRTTAAASVGVSDPTLSKWMARGRRAPPETPHRALYDAVTKAEAEWEKATLDVVTDAAEGEGARALRAAQWLLTHHPQARTRWGKQAEGEAGGKPMEVDVQGARDRLFAQLAAIAKKQALEIPGVTDVEPEGGSDGSAAPADQPG